MSLKKLLQKWNRRDKRFADMKNFSFTRAEIKEHFKTSRSPLTHEGWSRSTRRNIEFGRKPRPGHRLLTGNF